MTQPTPCEENVSPQSAMNSTAILHNELRTVLLTLTHGIINANTWSDVKTFADAMLHGRLIWRGVNDEVVRHKRNGAPNDTRQMP